MGAHWNRERSEPDPSKSTFLDSKKENRFPMSEHKRNRQACPTKFVTQLADQLSVAPESGFSRCYASSTQTAIKRPCIKANDGQPLMNLSKTGSTNSRDTCQPKQKLVPMTSLKVADDPYPRLPWKESIAVHPGDGNRNPSQDINAAMIFRNLLKVFDSPKSLSEAIQSYSKCLSVALGSSLVMTFLVDQTTGALVAHSLCPLHCTQEVEKDQLNRSLISECCDFECHFSPKYGVLSLLLKKSWSSTWSAFSLRERNKNKVDEKLFQIAWPPTLHLFSKGRYLDPLDFNHDERFGRFLKAQLKIMSAHVTTADDRTAHSYKTHQREGGIRDMMNTIPQPPRGTSADVLFEMAQEGLGEPPLKNDHSSKKPLDQTTATFLDYKATEKKHAYQREENIYHSVSYLFHEKFTDAFACQKSSDYVSEMTEKCHLNLSMDEYPKDTFFSVMNGLQEASLGESGVKIMSSSPPLCPANASVQHDQHLYQGHSWVENLRVNVYAYTTCRRFMGPTSPSGVETKSRGVSRMIPIIKRQHSLGVQGHTQDIAQSSLFCSSSTKPPLFSNCQAHLKIKFALRRYAKKRRHLDPIKVSMDHEWLDLFDFSRPFSGTSQKRVHEPNDSLALLSRTLYHTKPTGEKEATGLVCAIFPSPKALDTDACDFSQGLLDYLATQTEPYIRHLVYLENVRIQQLHYHNIILFHRQIPMTLTDTRERITVFLNLLKHSVNASDAALFIVDKVKKTFLCYAGNKRVINTILCVLLDLENHSTRMLCLGLSINFKSRLLGACLLARQPVRFITKTVQEILQTGGSRHPCCCKGRLGLRKAHKKSRGSCKNFPETFVTHTQIRPSPHDSILHTWKESQSYSDSGRINHQGEYVDTTRKATPFTLKSDLLRKRQRNDLVSLGSLNPSYDAMRDVFITLSAVCIPVFNRNDQVVAIIELMNRFPNHLLSDFMNPDASPPLPFPSPSSSLLQVKDLATSFCPMLRVSSDGFKSSNIDRLFKDKPFTERAHEPSPHNVERSRRFSAPNPISEEKSKTLSLYFATFPDPTGVHSRSFSSERDSFCDSNHSSSKLLSEQSQEGYRKKSTKRNHHEELGATKVFSCPRCSQSSKNLIKDKCYFHNILPFSRKDLNILLVIVNEAVESSDLFNQLEKQLFISSPRQSKCSIYLDSIVHPQNDNLDTYTPLNIPASYKMREMNHHSSMPLVHITSPGVVSYPSLKSDTTECKPLAPPGDLTALDALRCQGMPLNKSKPMRNMITLSRKKKIDQEEVIERSSLYGTDRKAGSINTATVDVFSERPRNFIQRRKLSEVLTPWTNNDQKRTGYTMNQCNTFFPHYTRLRKKKWKTSHKSLPKLFKRYFVYKKSLPYPRKDWFKVLCRVIQEQRHQTFLYKRQCKKRQVRYLHSSKPERLPLIWRRSKTSPYQAKASRPDNSSPIGNQTTRHTLGIPVVQNHLLGCFLPYPKVYFSHRLLHRENKKTCYTFRSTWNVKTCRRVPYDDKITKDKNLSGSLLSTEPVNSFSMPLSAKRSSLNLINIYKRFRKINRHVPLEKIITQSGISWWDYTCAEMAEFFLYSLENCNSKVVVNRDVRRCLELFFYVIAGCYTRDNPYHNFFHAIQVYHIAWLLLSFHNFSQYLEPVETLGTLLAALCHDVDHPGFNNNFLVTTQHPSALVYNDISVLENHHCSFTFRLLEFFPDLDFRKHMTSRDNQMFRKTFISGVLATDMHYHALKIETMSRHLSQRPIRKNNENDRTLITEMVLQAADISNSVTPFYHYQRWAALILDEFDRQSCQEMILGLTPTPFMNCRTVKSRIDSQIEFLEFLVIPMWKTLTLVCPSLMPAVKQGERNMRRWQYASQYLQKKKDDPKYNNIFNFSYASLRHRHPSSLIRWVQGAACNLQFSSYTTLSPNN